MRRELKTPCCFPTQGLQIQLPGVIEPEEQEALQRQVQGSNPQRMLRELAQALEKLAAEAPVIFCFEDLQWSDGATLEFLAYLAQLRERIQLLVLGTYQSVETVTSGHPLRSVFQELLGRGQGHELALELFSEAEVAATVFPDLLTSRPEQSSLRVWIPGCSTGEEAYSVAIVLQECLERRQRPCQVQIFATDVNRQAIEKARTGRYPEGIAADVSPERLGRYFTREEGDYRIRKEIREMMVFAPHNILADPPLYEAGLALLPQSPHLFRGRRATPAGANVSLCVESEWAAVVRAGGDDRGVH